MASTYTPIATYTVSGTTTNDVTFNSIPQTYTDLVIISNVRNSQAIATEGFWFYANGGVNPNSGSDTMLRGDGSAATSSRRTNDYAAKLCDVNASNAASGVFTTVISNVMNYTNSTTYKTILTRASDSTNYVEAVVSLWRETAAITRINLATLGAGYFVAGTTFTLYGITAA